MCLTVLARSHTLERGCKCERMCWATFHHSCGKQADNWDSVLKTSLRTAAFYQQSTGFLCSNL